MEHTYDIVIIGTGAGGGTLAYGLREAGARILLVERGDYLPQEPENWQPEAVFRQNRYKTKETWEDAEGRPFKPGVHYYIGGNTKVYGAALPRFRREDFDALEHEGGHRRGPSATTRWSLTMAAPRRSTASTANPATIPPTRRAPRLSPTPRCHTKRLSRPSPWRFGNKASILFICRWASTCATADAASAARRATAFPARSSPKATPTCAACGPRSKAPTSRS